MGAQFGDALNTSVLVPDGQQGPIPAATLLNLAANYSVGGKTSVFVTVKNLTDRPVIVDRTRGLFLECREWCRRGWCGGSRTVSGEREKP